MSLIVRGGGTKAGGCAIVASDTAGVTSFGIASGTLARPFAEPRALLMHSATFGFALAMQGARSAPSRRGPMHKNPNDLPTVSLHCAFACSGVSAEAGAVTSQTRRRVTSGIWDSALCNTMIGAKSACLADTNMASLPAREPLEHGNHLACSSTSA